MIYNVDFSLFMQLAFEAVLHLWNTKALKSLGNKGVESLLGILCHILRHKPEVCFIIIACLPTSSFRIIILGKNN